MALVSQPRCYYSGLNYGSISGNNGNNGGSGDGNNFKNSSVGNLAYNNSNEIHNSTSKYNSDKSNNNGYLSTITSSLTPPACSAPSIQTTFADMNGDGGDDSAGPSSASSTSTNASYASSLLAAPDQCQKHVSANRSNQSDYQKQRRNGFTTGIGLNDQSSSGCSSSSPFDGTDGGNATANVHPDKPIGYGAFGVVWSVTDPRSGKRVALKKMPNVFQNLASCKRVFREIRILSSFKHDNILCCLDILQPTNPHLFQEIYVITELMQSDLHKIIVSPQPLTTDHIKVFLYQILRGVKYLHSANIIHRDIKPGNLLVNSNCVLKICDFGLARMWDPSDQGHMTHEVVTQYYRAPELLMGARRYTSAVDVWSVGCIFAELLGRRILFQAQGPIDQLNMIIELLGTPTISQMKYACDGARCHVLKSVYRPPNAGKLYTLSSQATHEAVHLLTQMLSFDPDQRISVADALASSYLEEGRLRFHSCMCNCCYTSSRDGTRVYSTQPEPVHPDPFDVRWEKDLCRYSMYDLRDRIYKFVADRPALYNVPLCINPHSAAYKNFTSSSCAHFNEMPPSPQVWK